MKLIIAIIKPFTVEKVRDALTALGVQAITVSEVRGFGRQKSHSAQYRGAEYMVDFIPKTKIEIAVNDDMLDRAIEAIMGAARSGKVGDGKMFVYDIQEAVRIRTGETGTVAI